MEDERLQALDLFEALLKVLPVVHDDGALCVIGEHLLHLLHLVFALLDIVDADVADARDVGAHGRGGAALAVLDCDGFFRFDAELLAGVEVDLRVWLAAGWIEAGGGGVDVLVGEVLHQVGLLERGHDARLGRSADHGHRITLLLQLLELLGHARARLSLFIEFLNHFAQFGFHVVLKLLWFHGEVVLLLQTDHHAAEVLADKVLEQ